MEHDRSSLKEGTTQTVSVMPVLTALGWDTTNPDEVSQEIKAGGRVDIGLHINKEPRVFIEAKPGKQRRLTDRNKEQLLEYCENRKVRLGVLTNGFVWCLYSDAESKATKPNDYAVEINFDDSTKDIEESLECFLSKARVRYDYESVLRDLYDKRMTRILSGKWEDMLQRGHEGLASALWEEMKDESLQEQVSLDRVKKFIRQCSSAPASGRKEDVHAKTSRKDKRWVRSSASRRLGRRSGRAKIFAQEVEFESGADLLEKFLVKVHENNPKHLDSLVVRLPKVFVRKRQDGKRSWRPIQIADSGVWTSTNLNFDTIVELCGKVLKVLDLSDDSFAVISMS